MSGLSGSGYEQLRYSFDNILKELDDICKSIDDLTDIEQTFYSTRNTMSNSSSSAKTPTSFNQNQTKSRLFPQYNSTTNILNQNGFLNEEDETAEDTTFSDIRTNAHESYTYNNYSYIAGSNSSNVVAACATMARPQSRRTQRTAPVKPVRSNNFKLDNQAYEKFKNLTEPTKSTRECQATQTIESDEQAQTPSTDPNNFKKHVLPDDDSSTPLLNNVIGSASIFLLDSKTVTTTTTTTVTTSSSSSSSSSYAAFPVTKKSPSVRLSQENLDKIDDDYLNSSEVAKIECFYASMGCYVYVSRCIAELYQIKRTDEFDSMDNDPVNDYKIYMKKQKRKNLHHQVKFIEDNYYDNEEIDDYDDDEEEETDKSTVNYMYINSGVPVIVFNYGANPKRKKDLRILLAERSTGFCMWEFKFDRLTQFDNLDDMTVVRLTLNNLANADSISTMQPFNQPSYNSAQSINYQNEYFEKFFNSKNRHAHKEHLLKFVIKRDCDEFCYKLMKIMNDKRNSDLFSNDYLKPCSSNQSLNSLNSLSRQNSHIYSPAAMSSSSVIICHFDFLIYNKIAQSKSLTASNSTSNLQLYRGNNIYKNPSMSSLSFNGKFDENGSVSNSVNNLSGSSSNLVKKSSMKTSNTSYISSHKPLERKYSNSSSNIIPHLLKSSLASKLSRAQSFKSNINGIDEEDQIDEYDEYDYENRTLNPSINGSIVSNSVLNLADLNGKGGSTSSQIGNSMQFLNGNGLADAQASSNSSNPIKQLLVKYRKLRKSDISSPVNFNHVTHLDKPVPIGKRYKLNY